MIGLPRASTFMNRILIWDLPTRLFHWAFAGSVASALAISFLVDDDRPLFQLHMLFGIVAVFLLALRLVMGVAGSRYARFSSYPLRPSEVIGYLASAVFSKTRLYAGNNPGSALAALLMFVLSLGLLFSGTGWGGGEIEEVHETLAWAMLAVIVMHLLGLAWHTIRHRDAVLLAMVTGRKEGRPEDGIPSAHPAWGMFLLVGSGLWIAALFGNHRTGSASIKLPVIGTSIRLSAKDGGDHERSGKSKRKRHRDDDDD